MRPVDVKSNTYINSSKEINDENPKFKIGDNVRILTSKNIFAKCYGLKNLFTIKKDKNTASWTYCISDLNGEETVGTFHQKNCKNQIKKSLELKK